LGQIPLVILNRSSVDGSIVGYSGVCFDMFHALQEFYNLTYTVLMPKDDSYGIETANGSWNGIIGMVINKVADIGVQALSITVSRYQVIDYTEYLFSDPTGILIPAPSRKIKPWAVVRPFRMRVWAGILIVLALLPFIIWMYDKSLGFIHHEPSQTSLLELYLFVFRILLWQSNRQNIPRSSIVLGLLVVVWSFSAVILTNAYTGNIVSNLLNPIRLKSINSLDELSTSSLNWYLRKGTSSTSLIMVEKNKDSVYWKIGEKVRQNPELLLNSGSKSRCGVVSGKYAYIGEMSSIKRVMEEDYSSSKKCRITKAKKEFFDAYQAFVLRKNSPLQAVFNKKILQMHQAGLVEYWKLQNAPSISANRICQGLDRGGGPQELKLRDLQSAFIILAIGLCIATIALAFELLYSRANGR